ncbi:hypothetical protein GS429_19630 [Natronorubrum sp. JWXQ-INN-674]|uniref:Uncharacterized protein n=1 Tax=Natronorubrum halalkaliphilum TaxID=2691917 RepID=A0A6B0VS84_9EURY|nr:DUF5804 family protein [Natronorubrum halalkaliphilum]MXV64235.1 hypothetical protein [Natronorubrum halalkaliphilum]
MTRVCLIGTADCTLQYELLSRETSREALSTYDLERPFENSLALDTVSVGAAVSLLNDLNWYLTRFVDEALVQEPSISDDEWLSRDLARELRNGEVKPGETAEFCKIYGLERVGPDGGSMQEEAAEGSSQAGATASKGGSEPARNDTSDSVTAATEDSSDTAATSAGDGGSVWRLVEPLYVRRTDGELPTYDLRAVEKTLVVRLTEAEHSP